MLKISIPVVALVILLSASMLAGCSANVTPEDQAAEDVLDNGDVGTEDAALDEATDDTGFMEEDTTVTETGSDLDNNVEVEVVE